MSTLTIRPTHISPVIRSTIVGPAAPTPAEQRLQESHEQLRSDNEQLRVELHPHHNGINRRVVLLECAVITLQKRLSALELPWHRKVRNWFLKIARKVQA